MMVVVFVVFDVQGVKEVIVCGVFVVEVCVKEMGDEFGCV